ncbi:MAG: hypothetical protein GXX91_00675, partial [Verrucomicrobiaceae bacterium]|nr:hypothetical protein [Verrucomicrobiaceae bacterium]
MSELQILLRALPLDARKENFRAAILSENILGKPTESSRVKSLYHLTELYGLDASLFIFRTLRRLAEESPTELPLLAML